jgi:transposase, IS5 family
LAGEIDWSFLEGRFCLGVGTGSGQRLADAAGRRALHPEAQHNLTPVTSPKGVQFVLHAKALQGNSFEGHALGPAIADVEANTGIEVQRTHVDKGYRGHNHPHKFRVWITGQVRRVTRPIRREMKRRAAVEPVIGHVKAEHRMGRNYLKGRDGDRINAVLAAAGYNFSLLLRWLSRLLRALSHLLLPLGTRHQPT